MKSFVPIEGIKSAFMRLICLFGIAYLLGFNIEKWRHWVTFFVFSIITLSLFYFAEVVFSDIKLRFSIPFQNWVNRVTNKSLEPKDIPIIVFGAISVTFAIYIFGNLAHILISEFIKAFNE